MSLYRSSVGTPLSEQTLEYCSAPCTLPLIALSINWRGRFPAPSFVHHAAYETQPWRQKKKSEYSQRKALIIIKANIIIINNQSKHKFDKAVQFDEVIKSLFRRTRMVIEVSFCYDPKRSLNGKDSLMDPYVTLQAVVSANTPWIAHENRPRNWMFGINQRWRDIRYNEMDRCDICIY